MHVDSFFAVESYSFAVEYINVDDVIGYCLDLMNKMRWILIIFPFLYSQYNRNNRLTQP